MGVSHDQESHAAVLPQMAYRPVVLPAGRSREFRLIDGVIPQHRAEQVYQTESQVRMQELVDRGGCRVLDRAVDQPRLPAGLGQPVTMDRRDSAVSDAEGRQIGTEPEAEIMLPEVAAPTIMISPYHHDRHLAPQAPESRCHCKPTPGDYPAVGEPEIEQVTIDQETVTQRWDRLEKLEQRCLDIGRCSPQVSVRDNDESSTQHGAKDGLLLPLGPDQLGQSRGWIRPGSACRREAI